MEPCLHKRAVWSNKRIVHLLGRAGRNNLEAYCCPATSGCPWHALCFGLRLQQTWLPANRRTVYGLLSYLSKERRSNRGTSEKKTWKNTAVSQRSWQAITNKGQSKVAHEKATEGQYWPLKQQPCCVWIHTVNINNPQLSFHFQFLVFLCPLQASILDLHSGALSMGKQFVNIYRWGGASCLSLCLHSVYICGNDILNV